MSIRLEDKETVTKKYDVYVGSERIGEVKVGDDRGWTHPWHAAIEVPNAPFCSPLAQAFADTPEEAVQQALASAIESATKYIAAVKALQETIYGGECAG